MSERVNHPTHYNLLPAVCDKCGDTIECIEVVRHMNFNEGNVIKYLWRAAYKDGNPIEDLEKARWYLDDEINRLKNLQKVINTQADKMDAIKRLEKEGLLPFKRIEE